MQTQSVLIGLSGGVDSSVAAHILQKSGYICVGATMRLCTAALCAETPVEDARAVADRLGMEFHTLDFSETFREKVVSHFVTSYQTGTTPNPCIECNRHLKFGAFLDRALALGCERIATGHYARVRLLPNGRLCLEKAVDKAKDQTYFLYSLTQHQLAHALFPLGELEKAEVRTIAHEQGFVSAAKRDSQDICFIPDGDHAAFLQRYTAQIPVPGDFLDLQGNVVGRHSGAARYTLGQRKGLGLAMGEPVYVCSKDMAANTVTVGPNEALFHTSLIASDWNWMAFPAPEQPFRAMAKARSRMTEQSATICPLPDGTAKVIFDAPQRAITPGQAIVLYDGELVLGGGTIREVL